MATARDIFNEAILETGIDSDDVHNWMVVFSEALTNAIEHGARGNSELEVTVSWNILETRIELIVTDPGLGVAQNEGNNLLNIRGYGLTLMSHFCDEVEHLINPAGGHILKLSKNHQLINFSALKRTNHDAFSVLISEFYATLKIPMSIDSRVSSILEYLHSQLEVEKIEVHLSPRYNPKDFSLYQGTPPCDRCESCKVFPSGKRTCLHQPKERKATCLPIFVGDNNIGSILAVTKEIKKFSEEENKHLELATHCIGLAIEEDKQAQRRKTNEEAIRALQVAASLQQRQRQFKTNSKILQGVLSSFEERAESVAGDLIECFTLDKENSYFLIADVMGKGVAAAFLGGIFRGGWHLLAEEERHPLVLLKRLNKFLYEELNNQTMFVTGALAHINQKEKKLTVINAGHTAIYLQNKKGKLQKIEPSGPPLGLFPQIEYKLEVFDFKKFERLYMPTDGLFFWDEKNEEFSPSAIEEIFENNLKTPHKEIWDQILHARNIASREQVDDLSLLIWDKER